MKTDELLKFALGLCGTALDLVDVCQKDNRTMLTSLTTKRGACIDISFEMSYTEPPGVELPDVWLLMRAPGGMGLTTNLVLDLITAEALASAVILACRKAASEHIKMWGLPTDEETAEATLTRLAADAPQETEEKDTTLPDTAQQ